MNRERARLLLELADDELILGWRNSEWTGIAPFLEEDVAFSSIAQNEIGHARALYDLAAAGLDTDADALAFDRRPEEYLCAPLVQLRLVPDWALTIARHVLYETADAIRIERLKEHDDPELAGIAAKIEREEVYHRLHAEMWRVRLQRRGAVRRCGRRAVAVRARRAGTGAPARAGGTNRARGSRGGRAVGSRRRVRGALGRDDDGAPFGPGGRAVVVKEQLTEAAVWAALAGIADPEIPVISLVDLGVVKSVEVEKERVRIEFTPTFMGCPALDAMRSQMEAAVTALGGEPQVDVLLDDSWSTDKITPAGREKLREAGFAPPAPRAEREHDAAPAAEGRAPVPVLRLDRDAPRQHLRPDPVPLGALLHELQAALRAVQDDLARARGPRTGRIGAATGSRIRL